MIRKSARRRIIGLSIVLILLASAITGNLLLDVRRIRLEEPAWPAALDGLRIVQLSDLHLPRTPTGIRQVLDKTREAGPDLILLTGDLIDSSAGRDDMESLADLCEGLADIAPCYAVTGNHEVWSGRADEWRGILHDAEVAIVDDSFSVFQKNGASLTVAGLADETPPGWMTDLPSGPAILLCHRPEKFPAIAGLPEGARPDLVFSGHAHGGQFRIPFTRFGFAAPGQGLFPAFTTGVYDSRAGVRMVVSQGIGNSVIPIRLFDPPQLVVVEITVSENQTAQIRP